MKIISWNVNGIRAAMSKGMAEFLETEKADIVCLQEIKIGEAALEKIHITLPGYQIFWHSAERPGYSGTAVLVRTGLKDVTIRNGLGETIYDREGRVQVISCPNFYLLNVYFPNANGELSRLPYKLQFNNYLLNFVKKLEKEKPVMITGDFNVAHEEIDIARPKANEGSAGFTKEERAWFTKLLAAGYLDSFRLLYPDKIQYSWWSFRGGARLRNVGWRIDYFVISAKLRTKIKKAYILDQVQGSDHVPVGIEL